MWNMKERFSFLTYFLKLNFDLRPCHVLRNYDWKAHLQSLWLQRTDIIGKHVWKAISRARAKENYSAYSRCTRSNVSRTLLNVALYKRKASTRAETRGLLISTLATRVTSAKRTRSCGLATAVFFFFVFPILPNEKDGTKSTLRHVRRKNSTSWLRTRENSLSRICKHFSLVEFAIAE